MFDRFAGFDTLPQSCSGDCDDAIHDRLFIEFGHKLTPLLAQQSRHHKKDQEGDRDDTFGIPKRKVQQRRIERFDTTHQGAVGVFADPKHHIGEHRNEQQCDCQRAEHHKDDIQCHRRIEFARQSLETEQRNEDDSDDKQGEKHRLGDTGRRFGDHFGTWPFRVVMEEAEAVFDDDDRPVDDHSDRDGQSAETHQVG